MRTAFVLDPKPDPLANTSCIHRHSQTGGVVVVVTPGVMLSERKVYELLREE